MYEFIKGDLISASSSEIILEANGIGYRIIIPPNYGSKIPPMGNSVIIHTSFIVRELSQTLYGFMTVEERDFFEILITISGIGPKAAIAIIGNLTINDMQQAVHKGDTTILCRVPGIGKKSAERLIVEIKDKMPSLLQISPASVPKTTVSSNLANDAVRALINLGYQQNAARKTVEKVLENSDEKINLTTLLSKVLKS